MRRLAQALATLPPPVQDLALALALAALYAATLVSYRSAVHPFWLGMLLVVAQALPVAARRWSPVLVFAVIGLARLAYDVVPLPDAPPPLALAIAFFTVIERERPAVRRVICVLLVIGLFVSQAQPGHNEPNDFVLPALIFLTAWLAGTLGRTRRAYVAEVEARAARAEAERDAETARAASTERARIARELHDVVAHHVSLIAVQAEAATSLLPGRPAQAARSVEIIAATARQALTELRRLLAVLRRPGDGAQTAPTASLADIGGVLDQVREAGLAVDYAVNGETVPLSPGIDLTAYRIIQEALTNTVRHAHADRATVSVCYEPGFVTVRVADSGRAQPAPSAPLPVAPLPGGLSTAGNGAAAGRGHAPADGGRPQPDRGLTARGDDPPVPANNRFGLASSGFGLAGIAERVASCGGTLTVGPAESGFAVTARLPAP